VRLCGKQLSINLLENYSLKRHNTFGLEAKARYFVAAHSEEELRAALLAPEFAGLPRLILGGGSNLLLARDFPGVVIHVALTGKSVVGRDNEATYVCAAAGENWHEFVLWTLAQGLAGLENLSLIPGTLGASPMQNIGAYGVEMKDLFHELTALDLATGEARRFDRAACLFAYRDSVFKRELKDRYAITQVTFRLPHAVRLHTEYGEVRAELARLGVTAPTAQDVSQAVCNIRRRKLPDPAEIGNAGSFFKNPVVDRATFEPLYAAHPHMPHYPAPHGYVKLAAGWLIEQTGWKGKTLGRAGVHEKHALVLVNRGGARGAEILALAQGIQRSVEERFGIRLEPEPVIV
jgi:UDP-N-acetylmuramate dehydrogenase